MNIERTRTSISEVDRAGVSRSAHHARTRAKPHDTLSRRSWRVMWLLTLAACGTSGQQAAPQAGAEQAVGPGPHAVCEAKGKSVAVEYVDTSGGAGLQLRAAEDVVATLRKQLEQYAAQQTVASLPTRQERDRYDRALSVHLQDVTGGLMLTLTPARPFDLIALRRNLQQDVLAMQAGDCSGLNAIMFD